MFSSSPSAMVCGVVSRMSAFRFRCVLRPCDLSVPSEEHRLNRGNPLVSAGFSCDPGDSSPFRCVQPAAAMAVRPVTPYAGTGSARRSVWSEPTKCDVRRAGRPSTHHDQCPIAESYWDRALAARPAPPGNAECGVRNDQKCCRAVVPTSGATRAAARDIASYDHAGTDHVPLGAKVSG